MRIKLIFNFSKFRCPHLANTNYPIQYTYTVKYAEELFIYHVKSDLEEYCGLGDPFISTFDWGMLLTVVVWLLPGQRVEGRRPEMR